MNIQHGTASPLIVALCVALCLPPEARAQSASAPVAPPPQAQTTQQKPPAGSVTVNPSQPPLQPVTTYPDAAGDQQQAPDAPQPKTQPAAEPQSQQPQTEPQGAATAEKVPAAGGAAAKPAGVAIAPPKQHQTRSLLIKLGAVAAGAVAAGTIYALSRGTSSTPPGATSPGTVQKK